MFGTTILKGNRINKERMIEKGFVSSS